MISALGIVLYFLPHAWWQLLFITPIFAVANGLTQANIAALISKTADRSIQGEVLGINASVQALAQAIPPMLSGYIAASLSPEAPLIVSAIVIATAGFVFSIFYDSTSSNRLAGEKAEYPQSVEDSKQSEQSIHNEDEIIRGTIDL
jgi:MFS family permease